MVQTWCEWVNHEFGSPVLREAGRDKVRGPFLRYEHTCAKCGRRVTETRWLSSPGGNLGSVPEPKEDDRD